MKSLIALALIVFSGQAYGMQYIQTSCKASYEEAVAEVREELNQYTAVDIYSDACVSCRGVSGFLFNRKFIHNGVKCRVAYVPVAR